MERPGLLYVAATLLPLLSFTILLLIGGVRNWARPRRDGGGAPGIYNALGGDKPGAYGAFIATGAIAGSFICSLFGFILFAAEHGGHAQGAGKHGGHERAAHSDEPENEKAAAKDQEGKDGHGKEAGKDEKAKEEPKDEHTAKSTHGGKRWEGKLDWAQMGWKAGSGRLGTVLQLGFKIDNLTTIMFLMVSFIATLIHIFSMGYMAEELDESVADHQVHTDHGHLHRRGRFGRFFMFLSLFCFSMFNLVLADNLFQVFVSWELVGICSFLLVGFYYERTSASNAANKAFITNRVGDAGFIIGLLIIWTYVGTFNFDEIFARIRSPLRDSHGPIPMAAQIIRANPLATTSDTLDEKGPESVKHVRITTLGLTFDNLSGSEVVLFPRKLADHWHGLGDPKSKANKHLNDAVDVWSNATIDDFGSMPYWLLVVAGLGIFLGCVGKSAQFPLQVWLPDAMEGPTPVSALIHAATMVAAGVYLVGRVYPLFTMESRLVIAYTGASTLFVAATVALVVTDIKKVLAYSTVSQLGYMMLAMGVGGWVAGLFHLLTHAFFKALLFLCSGAVIYGCHHEQEMTKMGGLFKKMPKTALCMLMGVLAIAGTPLFTGWYSKDAIIAATAGFAFVQQKHLLLFLLPLATAGITTFYMFRMWFMTFTGTPKDAHVHEHAHEPPVLMTTPLIILAICSVCVAWGWPVWDAEASAMEAHVHHAQHDAIKADFGPVGEETIINMELGARPVESSERYWAEHFHFGVGMLALLSSGLGFVFAGVVYYLKRLDPAEAKTQFPAVHNFLVHKWYFDEAYSALLVKPALVVAGWCKWFDTKVIDGTVDTTAKTTVGFARLNGRFDNRVIDGLANLNATVVQWTANWLRTWQTGYLRSYVLFIVLAAISLYAIFRFFIGPVSAG